MKVTFVTIVLSIKLFGFGQQNNIPLKISPLVRAENEFSDYCAKHGIKESFLRYFDNNVVLFTPHAVNGAAYFFLEAADSGKLSWRPTVAEISDDGELGFTMGPVQYQAARDPKETVYHSHYFSVWQNNPKEGTDLFIVYNPGFNICQDSSPKPPAAGNQSLIIKFSKTLNL